MIWLTGLPCSGKTTLGLILVERLRASGKEANLLDGDAVRHLWPDLGFSREDREENIRRIAAMAEDLERAGIIANLELQPAFELQGSFKVGKKYVRSIKYIADFRVTDNDGTVRVIDTKGVRTAVFNVKLKMFQLKYPDVIFELWGRDVLKRMQ